MFGAGAIAAGSNRPLRLFNGEASLSFLGRCPTLHDWPFYPKPVIHCCEQRGGLWDCSPFHAVSLALTCLHEQTAEVRNGKAAGE